MTLYGVIKVSPLTPPSQLRVTWVGGLFCGLMLVCMVSMGAWAIEELQLQGRSKSLVYAWVNMAVLLAFAGLGYLLQRAGVKLVKKA